jgi:DNA-binding PadR family transcriptional regulator
VLRHELRRLAIDGSEVFFTLSPTRTTRHARIPSGKVRFQTRFFSNVCFPTIYAVEYYCIPLCTSMPPKVSESDSKLVPLPVAYFHILLSLGERERHGYALKREILRRTEGKLKLGPGVLYGSIKKMLELALIEESSDRPDAHLDDERRRYYRITRYGRKIAQAEAARMRELSQLAAATFGVPKHA